MKPPRQPGAGAWAALIIVLAAVAYWPALSGGFMFDDDAYLYRSPQIHAADGLYRFWFTTDAIDYYPLSNTSLWVEWRLWEMNPTGYHLTNLALHILAALLVWALLQELGIPGAALAALLFAVHPINVESVAWISQRKTLMAAVFLLLSMIWYLREVESAEMPAAAETNRNIPGRGGWYWLSLLAFVLAMLSKGSAAVLPLILPGLILWRRPLRWRDALRIAPFWIVAAVLSLLNVWRLAQLVVDPFPSPTLGARFVQAGAAIWFYLSKALLPVHLTVVYPLWHIRTNQLLWWLPLLAALLATIILWRQRHAPRESFGRLLLFAWGFVAAGLAPELGFTNIGFMQFSLVADHYLYISFIGIVAVVAAICSQLYARIQAPFRSAAVTSAAVLLGALVLLTWQQSRLYGDPIDRLYPATLRTNPACWMIQINLANGLLDSGRPQEAIEHYQQVLRLQPRHSEAHTDLGAALYSTNHPQEAIQQFQQALLINPNNARAHYFWGVALSGARRLEEAIQHYQEAIRLQPGYPEALNNLGNALLNSGRPLDAIDQFQQALQSRPDFPVANYNLGRAQDAIQATDQAIEHYRLAVKQKPDYAEAYFAFAIDAAKLYRAAESIQAAEQALQLARDQQQTALASTIEHWLGEVRAGRTGSPPPSDKSRAP